MVYSYEEVIKQSTEYFGGDELAARVFADKYSLRDNDGNLLEVTPEAMHRRLSKELARIEKKKFKKPLKEDEIYEYLKDFSRIVFQGSPMYGIGNPYQYVSVGNCFVIPSPLDSYLSIMHTDTQITQISCRRGGVGWDVSKLRPKGSSVRNAARTTSGLVEFMKRFSNTIREVGQHGRRGASLQSISCHHPSILDFIKVKQDLTQVTGSNISVQFTNEFMEAVAKNKEVELRYPVSQEDATEMGKNFPVISNKVKATDIWKEFIHSAWLMAEPGCMFIDEVHQQSPGVPYGHKETSSNPCGEQYLPPYASCRLLIQNLYGYVKNKFKKDAFFDFEIFKKDAEILQRFGDNLVDLEVECIDRILEKIKSDPEPLYIKQPGIDLWKNVKRVALEDRRTGCGFTGLADALASLGLSYASKEGIQMAGKIQKEFALSAYKSSVEMAKELGAFPLFDPKKDIQSGFIQKIKEEDPALFKEMMTHGRRNMVLLTVAPTGSVSCLTQTSSGLEPVFMLSYTRRKKGNPGDTGFKSDMVDANGDHWMNFTVYHKGLQDWMDVTKKSDLKDNPYDKSTAQEIDWLSRIKLQATIQNWVDNSISSTINLPANTTEETVSEIYLSAWKHKCKGVTVYRDGCRTGVLVDNKEVKKEEISKITKTVAPKRLANLPCDAYNFVIKGHAYYVVVGLLDGEPYEVFTGNNLTKEGDLYIPKNFKEGTITKSSGREYFFNSGESKFSLSNGHSDANADGLTRMISTSLRHGADVAFVVQQLEKTSGDMNSFAKALARALKKYIENGSTKGDKCGSCGSKNVSRQEGCSVCMDCGSSKCS